MKRNQKMTLGLLAACGAVAGLNTIASAQPDPRPTVVHISGATLLENFLNQPAGTLDFIDVDGNRASRGFPAGTPERQIQQLAPFDLPGLFGGGTGTTAIWDASTHLALCYSSVGSGNGLNELILNGRTFNLGVSGRTSNTGGPRPAPNATMSMPNRSGAYFNRYRYINSGVGNNADVTVGIITNDGNAGGFPIRAETTAGVNQFKALFTTPQSEAFTDSIIAPAASLGNFNEPWFDYNGNNIADSGEFADLDGNLAYGPLETFTDLNGNGRWDWLGSTSGTGGLTVIGGVTVDAAILDVPVRYAVRLGGTAAAIRNPGEAGYGSNARIAQLKTGANDPASNNANTLSSLAPAGVPAANINTASPDANTIFDTPLFFAPIAPTANFGVVGGLIPATGANTAVINMSDLQYLFGAGRASNGENLVVVTRDSGSGTRNGFQNSIGQDPSWGVGENIGARNNSLTNDRVGSSFLPSNKNGNPRVEETVYNSRLAVGYVGPERGLQNGGVDVRWLDSGYADILSVVNNLANYGGTTPQRPTLSSILNNTTGNAWVIGGPASFGTFGDPRANAPTDGGYGWMEPYGDTNLNLAYDLGEPFSDFNANSVRDAVDTGPAPLPFPMRNAKAAAAVNNITRSIDLFEAGFVTPFTPGELAAQSFILTNGLNRVQNLSNPTNLVANPSFNAALQTFILTVSGNVQGNPQYATYGSRVAPNTVNSRAGKVPSRATGTYSDSSVNAQAAIDGSFISQGGAALVGGAGGSVGRTNLPLRNLVAADFNADGLRNINDTAQLIGAWRQRSGGPAWVSPLATGDLASIATASGQLANAADACIEILGDFNADGNFDKHDVRYFADGLALEVTGPRAGRIDRRASFTALDNALNMATGGVDNNTFNTILATNPTNTAGCAKVYQPGDSRGDVANSTGRVTPGFQPIGAEGYAGSVVTDANTINGFDIDYVNAQFRKAAITDCSADWNTYTDAIITDITCDINGDLSVNQADVTQLVQGILGTNYGDANLDGVVNTLDLNLITAAAAANLGSGGNPFLTTSSRWSQGDINGDGLVTAADVSLVCIADINASGSITVQDIFDFLSLYFGSCPKADVNGSGTVTVQDIFDYLSFYFAGGCSSAITCP